MYQRHMRAFHIYMYINIYMYIRIRYDPTRDPPRTTDHRMDATAAKLRDARRSTQLPPPCNGSKTTLRSPVAPIKGAIKFL